MDIGTQAEVVLRKAGYETWPWTGAAVPCVCFENEVVVGFVHAFTTGDALLEGWRKAQEIALARYALVLRIAGDKAWNVYSVFVAEEPSATRQREIERIEEDLTQTRKIARVGVQTVAELTRVLLPLLPVISQPVIGPADYEARLQNRLKDVSREAVTAFLGAVDATDVARILWVDVPRAREMLGF
jgi:hypothetical protein